MAKLGVDNNPHFIVTNKIERITKYILTKKYEYMRDIN